jgi:AbrB family looped-hinge helix DNA binding protein
MKKNQEPHTAVFTVKGQIVIPQRLRKEFEIRQGTRALVYQDGDSIVLKPMTAKQYKNLRGSLKGTGALKVLMAERKREREL